MAPPRNDAVDHPPRRRDAAGKRQTGRLTVTRPELLVDGSDREFRRLVDEVLNGYDVPEDLGSASTPGARRPAGRMIA